MSYVALKRSYKDACIDARLTDLEGQYLTS